VATKERFLLVIAASVILGVQAFLLLGFVYGFLSPREWAIGLFAWFAVVLLWALFRKMTLKKSLASKEEPRPALDERSRKRILRGIWFRKAWIGVLAILLPLGVANGVAQRAWLPTSVGAGINLLWMYVTVEDIKRRRQRISLSRQ